MKRWHNISLALALIGVVAGLLLFAQIRESEPAAAQPPPTISLDMDTSDGPCADIDAQTSHSEGQAYSIGVCATNLILGAPIGLLSVDVLYDDRLNLAPEVPDVAPAFDDNPDANLGLTTWGTNLGTGWQCDNSNNAFPTGDKNLAVGFGDAFISCSSANGPWALGDDETSGVLAVITFVAIGGGVDTLSIEAGLLGLGDGQEIGTCNPTITEPMSCVGGTDTKSGPTPLPPVATPTSTSTPSCGGPGQPVCPTSTATPKAWTMTPTPAPTATPTAPAPSGPTQPPPPPPPPPPSGGGQPVVVPPPTGQGSDSSALPWMLTLIGIGVAGTSFIGAGLVLRRVRAR
jgi:hypothetical protein